MSDEIEILKKIDKYVNGKMTVQEADDLWLLILQRPEILELLMIEIYLHNSEI